jgi:hypothetical protein
MTQTPRLSFADLPPATLLAICDYLEGDGHGLYDASFLSDLGVPAEYAAQVTEVHRSDGTHKGNIYPVGGLNLPGSPVVPETTAVYSLDLYRRIGYDLKLADSPMLGRGFEARDWDRRIREHLAA